MVFFVSRLVEIYSTIYSFRIRLGPFKYSIHIQMCILVCLGIHCLEGISVIHIHNLYTLLLVCR